MVSSPSELDVLRENAKRLLLPAELAGWLHDIGKFCDLHVEQHSVGGTRKWGNDSAYKAVVDNPAAALVLSNAAPSIAKPRVLNQLLANPTPKAADFMTSDAKALLLRGAVEVAGERYSLAEVVMLGMPGFAGHPNRTKLLEGKDGWLPALLGVCHSAAHYDKQEPGRTAQAQSIPDVLVSSPFGYETRRFVLGHPERSLDVRLQKLPLDPAAMDDVRCVISRIDTEFRDGLGDTRRPINEVTLADWAFAVAAMFKSALAGYVLTSTKAQIRQMRSAEEVDHDQSWHVAWLSLNGLDFWSRAVRVPDLLGRQRLIEDLLDAVRRQLEDETPLGCEIYRDETGAAFLAPALPGDATGARVKALIEQVVSHALQESGLAGEIVPEVVIQPPDKEAARLDRALMNPPGPARADPVAVARFWRGRTADLCPVCGLRPQASPRSAAGRLKLCEVCAGRRAHRARDWSQKLSTTIWTDEVADENARLALLVGRFDLAPWLDGAMVKTLLVTDPASGTPLVKNPSFARLRRIWETTRRFWQEVLPAEGADSGASLCSQPLAPVAGRLVIRPANLEALGLEPWHAYDLVLGQARLSVLRREHDLISLDNLHYVARQLGSGGDVKAHLMERREVAVEEPVGYGSPNLLVGRLVIEAVADEPTRYLPAIPILAEPRTFMALLPATSALRVAQAIADKYAQEMGKVRNRLALTLGLVYFDRRMPLAAALETGRRILERRREACEAEVLGVEPQQADETGWPGCLRLRLAVGGREISLEVPTVMGDGRTHDVWYPYWRLLAPADGPRQRQFPGPDGGRWVHVTDLRVGDRVQVVPSTFDYEYLDVAARRYEVAYEGLHRRGAERCHRPYLLEELADLERVWQLVGPPEAMTKSQAGDLVALVEGRRAAWGLPRGDEAVRLGPDHPFNTLCQQALANAHWRRGSWKALAEQDRLLLQRAALSGMLADVLELHLTLAREARD